MESYKNKQKGFKVNGQTFDFMDEEARESIEQLGTEVGKKANTSDMTTELGKKQDTISDLSTIRENASKGATAYQKPTGGIPKDDLVSGVKESLNKADTALQEHQDISGKADKTQVATDIAAAVKAEADRAKAAEEANAKNISGEETRAKGVESTLSAQIATLQRGVAGGVGFVISMDDTTKVLSMIGTEAQLAAFNNWVDNSPRPCEVKKDFTDFAYLRNTAGVASSTNWLKRADGEADSHYNSDDKEDYLQLVEFENVNFGFFADNVLRTITVMFNFDENCPAGFHRWFKEDTKLHARYDSTFNATKGIDCCIGKNFTGYYSVQVGYQKNKDTNDNLMEWTAWEYAVYTWIMCMYYRGFDSQTLLGSGITSGSQSAAEAFVNGLTDSLTTPHGKVATTGGEAIRFMYIENPYGLRWIWCAGWRGDLTIGKWTRDDEKANAANIVAAADCEETHTILATSQTYAKNVNILGILSETGGSSTSGFYDGNWSNIGERNRILYVGGFSITGVLDGVLARSVGSAVSTYVWDPRGRCAVRKSAVVSA